MLNGLRRRRLRRQAQIHAANREWAEAARLYRQVTALGRARASDWVRLGRALDEARDKGGAEVAYRRATAEFPDLYNTHRQLGVFLWARGDVRLATRAFLRAWALAPDEAVLKQDVVRVTGTSQVSMTQTLEAFLSAETPTGRRTSETWLARQRRKAAKTAFNGHDWSRAIELGRRLTRMGSASPHDVIRLSLALKETESYVEALTANWRALALRPRDPEFYLHLGHCLKKLGDPAAAANAYMAAWRLQPGRRDVEIELRTLGWSAAALEDISTIDATVGGRAPPPLLNTISTDVALSHDRTIAQISIYGDLLWAIGRNS